MAKDEPKAPRFVRIDAPNGERWAPYLLIDGRVIRKLPAERPRREGRYDGRKPK